MSRTTPRRTAGRTIRFVGVWDTVAAYGGPITEITRAIDNWIFPLSMPDYQLNERVLCARHALAIDDERDAFQPLLWDEVHEAVADRTRRRSMNERLEQVWFTGMHADVGGGYPDESLSYVSLLWMMEEAEQAGLRTLKVVKDRIRGARQQLRADSRQPRRSRGLLSLSAAQDRGVARSGRSDDAEPARPGDHRQPRQVARVVAPRQGARKRDQPDRDRDGSLRADHPARDFQHRPAAGRR